MKVFIKILKFVAGTVLGLIISFLVIVGLEAVLSYKSGNAIYGNLWLFGGILVLCVFLCNYLFFIGSSSKKIHTKGIELLPESIGELIDGIIDAMKYRRSVRVEVRQELTDHFTDVLADCENEQEKQQCVKELIDEFGDVKLLGKLLRRAKKRCRPLWRTMIARAFQLVGLCIVLLILYIGWFFTGKPQITTNYLEVLNQQVRPVADDSQNAWPFYKQAAEKRVEYEDKDFDFHPTKPSPFTRSIEDKEIIRQMINDNQQSLDLIRQGNQKPYYWQTYATSENYNQEMMYVLVPHLGEWRDLSRLMCWQGLLSAEQGDFEKGLNDIMEAYSFGQHLRGQNTTLIEQLVAMSIERTSLRIFQMVLSKHQEHINSQLLKNARKQFVMMIEKKDFIVDFATEKLFMYDEAQRSFTKSHFGRSHLYLRRLSDMGCFNDTEDIINILGHQPFHILFTHPDKKQTLKEIERLFDKMEKMVEMTPASVNSQGLNTEVMTEEIARENIFIGILMPALGKVGQKSWRSRTETCAILTILAVIQYEKEHGEYPESLSVLVEKGLLKEIPIDPFSDEPLVYRRTDSDFILYSVGSNYTDDSGTPGSDDEGKPRQWDKQGDWIFWRVE